jgi:presenilin-like A22 family membrane protease
MAEEYVHREPIIEHPNRDKSSSKTMRVVIIVMLLISAALILVITIGGWEVLQGLKLICLAWSVIYVVFAYFVARWNRGVLPVVAALAIIMAIFALIAMPGWFDRDATGFEQPALDAGVLGTLTAILVPVQLLLLLFAMQGFNQGWNVEFERWEHDDEPSPVAPAAA